MSETEDFDFGNLLGQVYGPYLKDWNLSSSDEYDDMFVLGNHAPVGQVLRATTTTLKVRVNIPHMEEMLDYFAKGYIKSSTDYTSLWDLSEFAHARSRNTYKEPGSLNTVIEYEYFITDYEDFVKSLKNKAWINYNKLVDKQISEVLDVDDR